MARVPVEDPSAVSAVASASEGDPSRLDIYSTIRLNSNMDTLSGVLSALSHPSRRAMIARLSAGSARVTDIAEPFDMSLNAVSKHLKVLEQAGLVRRLRKGRDHIIEFKGEPLREVVSWLHPYEKFWNERLDHLERFFVQSGSTK
jgi:DNA-binding transcriptional ArsR family regulator